MELLICVPDIPVSHKSVLPHLLNVARRLALGLYDKFYGIWATWIHYNSKALLDSQSVGT